MRVKRVGHVNLSVDDVERARAFYGGVLGLSPAPRPADPGGGRAGCWFALGDVELHISEERGADNARSKRHVALEVEDLDGWRARFAAEGMAVEDGQPLPGLRRVFVRDPAGNRLEIYETVL
jgi:catechol 2,3-dioxygenase-like lactoylglutathione lyase family enzyme